MIYVVEEKPIDDEVWEKIERVLGFDAANGTPAKFHRYINPSDGPGLISIIEEEPTNDLRRCALVVPGWYNYAQKVAPKSQIYFNNDRIWTYLFDGNNLKVVLCNQIMGR